MVSRFARNTAPLRTALLLLFQLLMASVARANATEQGKLDEGLLSADSYGYAVALSGDTAVVGAYLSDLQSSNGGAVYVYVWTGTTWAHQQTLTASDSGDSWHYGRTLSIDGDTLVVGAYGADSARGKAYVYVRSHGVWTEQQTLVAPDGVANDRFANSVAISGDTVVIGAPQDEGATGTDTGSAYVFVRSAGVWSFEQKLVSSTPADWNGAGTTVALDGDTALIGAPYRNGGAGSVIVFVRTSGTWSEQEELTAATQWDEEFGWSFSISGDTVVVGAAEVDGMGAAYVFERNGNTWAAPIALTASDAAPGDRFGASVAIDSDTIVVGADQADRVLDVDVGAMYVFARNGASFSEDERLTPAEASGSFGFGNAVALSGNTALGAALPEQLAYPFVNVGPAAPVVTIPTLSEWGMITLGAFLGLSIWSANRRKSRV